MKRAIVVFMVIAGLAMMMAGCGEEEKGTKPGQTNTGTKDFMPSGPEKTGPGGRPAGPARGAGD